VLVGIALVARTIWRVDKVVKEMKTIRTSNEKMRELLEKMTVG